MIGIHTGYNNYFSGSVQQAKSASSTVKNSNQDYLSKFKDTYPSLKFSIGYANTNGPSGTGLGNVVIHPGLLKKMESNPEFAAQAENNIKYIPQGEAWLKNMVEAGGSKLVASGCFVDENGNVGSWSMSSTTIEKEDSLMEQLAEKRLELERMLAKRADQRRLDEKLWADAIHAGLMKRRYEANYSTTST